MADTKKLKKKTEKEEKEKKNTPVEPADEVNKADDEGNNTNETDAALTAENEKLKKDLEEEKNSYLRLAAEFDNYKKRTAKETLRIGADTRASLIKELLTAVDNFTRAADNADASYEDYKKGIELSIKSFTDVLTKQGLEEIEALGVEFNPDFHFAVSRVEDETLGQNIVANVLQKGYKIGDNVIRPAMVSVANCD